MSEPKYDFRDGILLEKVVYKDDSCNCAYILLYLCCLLLTWIWGCGWFALFFYSYIFHQRTTFIVFIVIWGVFAIVIALIGFLTIQKSKNEKLRKKLAKEEREKQLKEINEAKKRRNDKGRYNIMENTTNIEHNNKNDNESDRRLILESEDVKLENKNLIN